MTKQKSTKRALLTSALALLLCVSMLIGSTFAWFTDSVVSGNNKIVAGNLDVELYHTNGTDTDEKVSSTTTLFDEVTLWEPGAMVWEKLTVKNLGTLALKYNLTVNISDISEVNGKSLADVLKVAVMTDQPTRENIIAAEKQSLETFSLKSNGVLDAKTGEDTFFVAIYWAPSADDNDYNVAGEALYANIGVTLLATQATVESDSFGNQYDKDAVYDGQPPVDAVKAASFADLKDALVTGGNVVLTSDFVITTDFDISKNTVIYAEEGVTLTFDHRSEVDIGGEGTLTFKDVDTHCETEMHANGNIVFDGGTHEWGVLAIEGDAVVTIKDGTFKFTAFNDGQDWTPDIVLAEYGTLNIEGGEITLDDKGDHSIRLGWWDLPLHNVTVNITGGTINSGIEDLFYVENSKDQQNNSTNTHAFISGGVFNLNSGKILTDTYTWEVPGEYADGIATITGGTFFTSRSDRVAAYVADGYELVGDETNGYVVSAK